MCGVCGMAWADETRSANRDAVETMNGAMIHRGPDAGAVWQAGPVALGTRRLSVIDVEHGRQPMATPNGRYAIAFNGEIYNTAELRGALEAEGHRFRTRCDTEVVLHACVEHGIDAPLHLNGMFAFAFHDRETGRLLLARDRLGVKPLYVCESKGALWFASELTALIEGGCVSGKLDPASLDEYFRYLYVPEPNTIYQHVRQLLPGERVVWERGAAQYDRYWKPSYAAQTNWTLDTAAARYRELLYDAVSRQRVSDVPLGAFLSGGMDSASVVAALAEGSAAPVKTYTIGFEEPEADERRYAAEVAQRFGTEHTAEVMRPDPVALLPKLIRHFGQPFADSSAIPTYLVSELARDSVTVALSGDGGDELFAGYSWLHMNQAVDRYRRVPHALRRIVDGGLSIFPATPRVDRLRNFSADSFVSPRESFRRRQSAFTQDEARGVYTPDLAGAIAAATRDRYAQVWDMGADLSINDRMLNQDLQLYLPGDVLTKVDRMSMAVSLEVRVPLLDHRLVEFAGELPFSLKFARGESKRIVKHAFKGHLPDSVLRQRKRGFAIPIDRWFREALDSFFRDTVLASDSHSEQWLDRTAIESLLNEHQSGRRNAGHRLWAVLAFELWLRDVSNRVTLRLE